MTGPLWLENPMWLEATQRLRDDPEASILCPSCKKGKLEMMDMPRPAPGDVYACCPQCTMFNFLLFGPWDHQENAERAFDVMHRLLGEANRRREAEQEHRTTAEPVTAPEADARHKRWIDAVNTFHDNPKALVPCPKCGQGNLELFDVGPEGALLARWMRCPRCGANEVADCAYWNYDEERQAAIRAWQRESENERGG